MIEQSSASTVDSSGAGRSGKPDGVEANRLQIGKKDSQWAGDRPYVVSEAQSRMAQFRARVSAMRQAGVASYAQQLLADLKDPNAPSAEELYARYTAQAGEGDKDALRMVAVLDEFGIGTTQNFVGAAAIYRRLASNGEADAMVSLARLTAAGQGVPQDYSAALALLEEAYGEQSSAEAAFLIATAWMDGWTEAPDMELARRWLEIAAAGDNVDAILRLYSFEVDRGSGSSEAARAYLERAAALGSTEAQIALWQAEVRVAGAFTPAGLKRLMSAAEAGDSEAYAQLALLSGYEKLGDPSADLSVELGLFEQARLNGGHKVGLSAAYMILRIKGENSNSLPLAIAELEEDGQAAIGSRYALFLYRNRKMSLLDALDLVDSRLKEEGDVFLGRAYSEMANAKRVADAIARPRIIHTVAPVYPEGLRADGVAGTVRVEFIVDREGIPRELHVVDTDHPLFSDAAIRALEQWRFDPMRNAEGQPMSCLLQIDMPFTIDGFRSWDASDEAK